MGGDACLKAGEVLQREGLSRATKAQLQHEGHQGRQLAPCTSCHKCSVGSCSVTASAVETRNPKKQYPDGSLKQLTAEWESSTATTWLQPDDTLILTALAKLC